MSKKKMMDKYLTRLQSLQRDYFKQDSETSIELHPWWCNNNYSIHVTIVTHDDQHVYSKESTVKTESFTLYSFNDDNENDEVISKIIDALTEEEKK